MTRCAGGPALELGYLVLFRQTAWKGRHKIQERWENEEYQVVGQPTPGVLVFKILTLDGNKTRNMHTTFSFPRG